MFAISHDAFSANFAWDTKFNSSDPMSETTSERLLDADVTTDTNHEISFFRTITISTLPSGLLSCHRLFFFWDTASTTKPFSFSLDNSVPYKINFVTLTFRIQYKWRRPAVHKITLLHGLINSDQNAHTGLFNTHFWIQIERGMLATVKRPLLAMLS